MEVIYTIKEAADYLGVNPSAIHWMEKLGLLSSTKTSSGQKGFTQRNLEECRKKNQPNVGALVK